MTDIDEIASAGETTPESDIKSIQGLAVRMLDLIATVAECEDRLKQAQTELRTVQEQKLPELMEASGLSQFKLQNGMTISLVEDLKVSVPRNKKANVCAKMREWGYEGSIKNNFVVELGKGSDNQAKALLEYASEMGLEAQVTEDIATATVKKALRDRMKEGKHDELSEFGAFRWTRVNVK